MAAAMAAAAGIVRTRAHTICPATPQRTADKRRVEPTPTIAPVIELDSPFGFNNLQENQTYTIGQTAQTPGSRYKTGTRIGDVKVLGRISRGDAVIASMSNMT